jgi:dolichol kinase
MFSGIAIVSASPFFPSKQEFAIFLGLLTLFDLLVEGSRLVWPAWNRWVMRAFRPLLRLGEERRLSGITYYLLGCTIAVIVFPREIALLSILFLAVGDPIASIVGVARGKRPWPSDVSPSGKSVEGTLACFALCALISLGATFCFGSLSSFQWHERLLFAFLGGMAAALGELLPLRADDNFAMPLIAGTTLWVTSAFFQLIPGLYLP